MWQDRAECRDMSGEVFFPDRYDKKAIAFARRVCQRCPVAGPCLAYALDLGEQEGVWGGTLEHERRRLRRERAGR